MEVTNVGKVTIDEAALLSDWATGKYTADQLAKRCGVSGWAVRTRLVAAGVYGKEQRVRHDTYKELPEAEVIADWHSGEYTQAEVAARHGVSQPTLIDWLRRHGESHATGGKMQDAYQRTAVLDAEMDAVQEMYTSGKYSAPQIARQYSVDVDAVESRLRARGITLDYHGTSRPAELVERKVLRSDGTKETVQVARGGAWIDETDLRERWMTGRYGVINLARHYRVEASVISEKLTALGFDPKQPPLRGGLTTEMIELLYRRGYKPAKIARDYSVGVDAVRTRLRGLGYLSV